MKPIWVVFDLDNGDEDKGFYCWWFRTRSQARSHIKWQRQQKFGAELSSPKKYVPADSEAIKNA